MRQIGHFIDGAVASSAKAKIAWMNMNPQNALASCLLINRGETEDSAFIIRTF